MNIRISFHGNVREREREGLIPAKILLYMNRNVSVIANSGYNEISVITSWFCYPQSVIMLLVTKLLITNHMFRPCEKFKLDITKWVTFSLGTILKNGSSYSRWLVSAQVHEI